MANEENFRPFFISKEVLDTINSIAWFIADAAWMLGSLKLAVLFMIPTILSGLVLLYVEKRPSILLINLAINCWIFMNTLWILIDVYPGDITYYGSRAFFGLGILSIVLAGLLSQNLQETFSHFKRFRSIRK